MDAMISRSNNRETWRGLLATAVGVTAGLAVAAGASAGITYESAESTVSASVANHGERTRSERGDPNTSVGTRFDIVTVTYSSSATASQRASFGQDGISATSTETVSVRRLRDNIQSDSFGADTRSVLMTTFSLDTPYDYRFNFLSSQTPANGAGVEGLTTFQLKNQSAANAVVIDFAGGASTFPVSGTLQPGTYSLGYTQSFGSRPLPTLSTGSLTQSFDLTLSALATLPPPPTDGGTGVVIGGDSTGGGGGTVGVGGSPHSIPLPPAAWPGLITLTGIGCVAAMRRLRITFRRKGL